jgi:putative hydrolase of the HAD superfamily
MNRNVVFDLGNVLLSFLPEQYLEKSGIAPEKRKTILNDIFHNPVWKKLDNGDLTTEEAINLVSSSSSLKRAEIIEIFNRTHEILFPLDSNVKTLPELKKRGYRLYYISNFPATLFNQVRNRYTFFGLFDGGIISSHVRLSKPDIRIFEYFLNLFEIRASDCLFIDDIKANTESAAKAGMHVFTTYGSEDISNSLFGMLNFNPEPGSSGPSSS